jgi:predicted RNase H-like HicB family nuclease
MQKLMPRDKLKIAKDGIEYEFEVAEKGGYFVCVPEFPGCVSEGQTSEEAWK